MTYEDVVIEDIINELKEEMRNTKGNSEEYRIAKKKIGLFRLPLLRLYHKAFKQGVYVGKYENK